MGKRGRRAKFCRRRGGASAVWRWSVAVVAPVSWALAPSTVNSADWANFKGGERSAALEEAFFETLGRCESPFLVERNEAEDALFERFAEFESIWQDRRFLTNGEVGAEARQRFELAETRYREEAFEDCVGAFKTALETFASENEEGRARDEAQNVEQNGGKEGNRGKEGDGENSGGGGNEGNEGNGQDKENIGILRGRVRLRWEKPLRIVYLSPEWSAFERRDAVGKRWRPSGRFSAPELAPEFDASELTFETIWERVDEEGAPPESKNEQNATLKWGNGENQGVKKGGEDEKNDESGGSGKGGATVVGVVKGLIGGDFRVWTLPLGRVAMENAEDGENKKNKKSEQDGSSRQDGGDEREGENARKREKRDAAAKSGDDRPSVFQSGDAVATVGETTINENGETTARVRFEFVEAFDAFDSHRVWFDKDDFALAIDCEIENQFWRSGLIVDREKSGTQRKASEDGKNKTGERVKEKEIGEVEKTGEKEKIRKKGETGEKGETSERDKEKEIEGIGEAGETGRRWAPVRLRVRERSANGALFELDFPNDAALREAVAQGRARLACRIPRFFFEVGIEIRGMEKRKNDEEFAGYNDQVEESSMKIEED